MGNFPSNFVNLLSIVKFGEKNILKLTAIYSYYVSKLLMSENLQM